MEPTRLQLGPAASDAVQIVGRLRAAGHSALLAGGCVRDLLLGTPPTDYDVATSARPEQVIALFRHTRKVGAQFGVVLVRLRRRWIEVATFRCDGPYLDGRHPSSVSYSDAWHDAQRRDFSINGMFLDPADGTVFDYVGGADDVHARRIRAIGDPAERFAEDHLRLLRAVRFAARLGFEIETATAAAIRALAEKLALVAAERVREELERILAHRERAHALELLESLGLLTWLWAGATWAGGQAAAARRRLAALPAAARFELALATLLLDRPLGAIHDIGRALTLSNEQRESVAWLVTQQASLDRPSEISLAQLKRRMAHPDFADLRTLAEHVPRGELPTPAYCQALAARIDAIDPSRIRPAPWVTGDDLKARGIAPGPVFKRVLDELYEAQLNEELGSRDAALARLAELLGTGRA